MGGQAGRQTPALAVAGRGSVPCISAVRRPRTSLVLAPLLAFPWVATPFFTFQIGAQSLALGLIALSLTFLGGYGGMISLAQMTVAGIAGYMVAIFGAAAAPTPTSAWAGRGGWRCWSAIAIATLCAAFIGWLSVRTEGIYTIMITLAIGVAFYYLCLQNYSVFNGFQGFQRVQAPSVLGIDWREPLPFYYLALFWALAGYFFVKYLLRAPFGIALQGIRDNPRRMNALGFNVTAHRVAAYAVAGVIAAVGGVLLVWYNGLIAPGSVGTALADQHPDHRGARRHAPSDRRVHRRHRVRAAAELRHRPHRPRALQPRDRRRVPRHRAVLARRPARLVGGPAAAFSSMRSTSRVSQEEIAMKQARGRSCARSRARRSSPRSRARRSRSRNR